MNTTNYNKIQAVLERVKQHRKLLFAVLPSLVFHGFMFMLFSIELPELESDIQLIEARLVQLEMPKELEVPKEVVKAVPAPKPVNEPEPPKTPPEKSMEPVAPKLPVAPPEAETPSANWGTLSSATLNMGNSNPSNIAAQGANIETENIPYEFAAEPEALPYTRVEAEFEVKRGSDASAAGVSSISFHVDKNKHYTITSQTEAKGLVSLFFSTLQQKSEGSVTEAGLKPEFYTYQYGNKSKKLQTASFDWEKRTLTLRNSKGESQLPLAAGTQDFLSFMYQFMFVPPLDNLQIIMTNGKKLGTYHYSFEGEEIITSKFGELNTIHLLKSSDDEEKTEIWLATDYQYLPVKIRKTEKDGTVIEQLVSKLSTSQIPESD